MITKFKTNCVELQTPFSIQENVINQSNQKEINNSQINNKDMSFKKQENSSDKKDEEWTYDSDVELKPNDGYYIINGHKFYEDEIVIGDDNIRDWKIKNIIE